MQPTPGSIAPQTSLSVVIVTWNSAGDITKALTSLGRELRGSDEVIIVDNGSTDGTVAEAEHLAEGMGAAHSGAPPAVHLVRNAVNHGFVDAVNQGGEAAAGDLLVLFNPDAEVSPGWRDEIVKPETEGWEWGAWQPLITSDGGTRINSDGNRVHFTGVSWAGNAGRPIDTASSGPREVGYASGACLVTPMARWREVGGLPPRVFMYGDDVDVCLRLRLGGHAIGIVPSARVEHGYEFDKGARKWRFLERSRWAFILRTYPTGLLLLLLPALAATELAIVAVSVRQGWLPQKVRAIGDVLTWLGPLLRERRAIQADRAITSREFARHLAAELDSDYLVGPATGRFVNAGLRLYWWVVNRAL